MASGSASPLQFEANAIFHGSEDEDQDQDTQVWPQPLLSNSTVESESTCPDGDRPKTPRVENTEAVEVPLDKMTAIEVASYLNSIKCKDVTISLVQAWLNLEFRVIFF